MSKASLFSNRTVRFVALSIVVGGVILLVSSFVTPTLSCPGPPPQPLRLLYIQSQSIVIARVGKSEITKVENLDGDDSDAQISHLKTALLVSSTLKGEPQPVVYVNHTMYRDFKDQLSSMAGDENLLVFLNKVEGMDGYEVDMNFGLKKLPDADLDVYVSRIEELGSIMKSGNPGDAEIVEWLVRCAEEPATRWDGTYELLMSHYVMEQPADENSPPDVIEESENKPAETQVENEGANEIQVSVEGYGYAAPVTASFAKLLTTEQKYRLTTALINNKEMTNSDYSLLDLVQRWDDPRLVPYLLAQLDLISRPGQNEEMGYYFTENLMTIVADKLGDEALKATVKRFNGNFYEQAESYEGEDESSEQNEKVAETNPEQEAADEAAAVQRRSTELQHFVTLALSTVPKMPSAEPANPVASAQP